MIGEVLLEGTNESEVAHSDVAGFVDEYVGGFDISVNELGCVQVVEGVDYLVEDVVFVDLLEEGVSEGDAEVCFQKLLLQIDVFVVAGLVVGDEFDYVGVIQFLQVFNLAVGLLGVSGVSKGIVYLFEGADVA